MATITDPYVCESCGKRNPPGVIAIHAKGCETYRDQMRLRLAEEAVDQAWEKNRWL